MKFEDFISRFEHRTKSGGGWMLVCPAHADSVKGKSLHASPAADGSILLKKSFRLDGVSIEAQGQSKILDTSLPNMLADADLVLSSPQSLPPSVPNYGLYFCRICPDGALTAALPSKLAAAGN